MSTSAPHRPQGIGSSWLESVELRQGPIADIGRFLLAADLSALRRGTQIAVGDASDLARVNAANLASWYPLVPPLDAARADLSPDRYFCLLGHDAHGACVATISGRFYDWTGTDMFSEVEAMRFFYDRPETDRRPGESCRFTAQSAREITGRVAYIGGAWYRPDYRKRGLPGIFSRIARVYAKTRWSTDFTIGFMSEKVVAIGLREQIGHPHIEWGLDWTGSPLGDLRLAMVWTTDRENVEDMLGYTALLTSEDDAAIHERRS
jgi:hypothetical protein